PLIRDTVGEPSHKDVVVDPIEKFLQIAVYYPRITLCDVLLGLLHRLMSALSGSKTVTVERERRIKKRREDLQNGLLNKAIKRDGYPQLSGPSARLRYGNPSYRLGGVISA